MNAEKRYQIFQRLQAANPNPSTELLYSNHFELLVAVMLSAHATDKSVNKATPALFAVANTPEQMVQLGEAQLYDYIKQIGLAKTKASNIIRTAQILVQQYQAQVPETREALESLPGVGRKTANVILNSLFGQATIAVDTHLFRVANRTHLAPGKTVISVEKKLMAVVPEAFVKDAHHWLVLHGRYICVARKPLCHKCIINDLCEYPGRLAIMAQADLAAIE